jgi:hypothetical protein
MVLPAGNSARIMSTMGHQPAPQYKSFKAASDYQISTTCSGLGQQGRWQPRTAIAQSDVWGFD